MRRLWILLAAAGVLAVGVILDQSQRPPEIDPVGKTSPVVARSDTGGEETNPLARHRLGEFDEILRRPLFTPGRHPEQDIVPADRADQADLSFSDYTLSGTVVAPGGAFALLLQKSSGKIFWLSQGQAVEGWILKSADIAQAEFQKSGVIRTIKAHARTPNGAQARADTADAQAVRAALVQHPVIPTDGMIGIGTPADQ